MTSSIVWPLRVSWVNPLVDDILRCDIAVKGVEYVRPVLNPIVPTPLTLDRHPALLLSYKRSSSAKIPITYSLLCTSMFGLSMAVRGD
eukprot:scaffold5326_cov84-Skeletonema_dohrnii-CCMP3373.AAC.3